MVASSNGPLAHSRFCLASLVPLTLLRHSYVSHMLAYGQLSIKDREELARDMCHSVNTQAQYQFITPNSKLPADK